MENYNNEILKCVSLGIGYRTGTKYLPILPPLTGSAFKGELVALLGRNSVGKSTLLRTIAGLLKPLSGSVLINNENSTVFNRLKFARSVGYISTEIVKVNHMRICDLVALGRFPHTDWMGRIDHNTSGLIRESIAKAGLENYHNRYISELSDGERQRAMIARVLAQDTDIMIMDEPLAFLDISGKYGIIKLMKELASCGKTIIFSTHDMNLALNHADKIWLVNDSGLRQGSPEDLWLGKDLDCLFDAEETVFNQEDGTFIFIREKRGVVCLEGGEEKVRYWTAKALNRAGYTIKEDRTHTCIKIHPSGNQWIHCDEQGSTACKTLYDLIRLLK